MDPVTILIFNSLVKRDGVYLPQVGLLHVVSNPAVRNPDGSIVPPNNDVRLSEVGDGLNIIDMIMSTGDKDRQAAERIYDKWLAGVSDNGTIRIESVGTVSEGRFVIDERLHGALNPVNSTKTVAKQPGKANLTMTIVLAAIIGVALSIGVITYLDHNDRYEKKFKTREAAVTTSEQAPAQQVQETPEASAPTAVHAAETTDAATHATSDAGYYVIIGQYSTDENAERFIAESRKKDNTLQYGKLPLSNGKIMVYTSKWATEEEARKHRSLGHFPEAWVYKHGK